MVLADSSLYNETEPVDDSESGMERPRINLITYLYVSMLIILVIALFSFILGPYSYVEYYKYINNGLNPSKYLQYGAMYYLIPRVLKESIKTPVYIFLVFSIIVAIKYQFNNVINTIKTKW